MRVEKIKEKYEGRILAVLNAIRKKLQEAGHDCNEPTDMSSDDFWWSMTVDGHIDVSLKICESEQYDGESGGVNFAVDIVEHGGRILGGLTPYNYTNKVWVSRYSPAAVEERFRIIEQADPADVIQCVEKADD